MIIFEGALTEKCRKFCIRVVKFNQLLMALIFAIVFAGPIFVMKLILGDFALLFCIPGLVVLLFALLPISKNQQRRIIPVKVIIDNNEIIIICEVEAKNGNNTLSLGNTIKMVDYGEWYAIKFESMPFLRYCICQKSLLTQGTLEEFEALFEGKIERKTLTK